MRRLLTGAQTQCYGVADGRTVEPAKKSERSFGWLFKKKAIDSIQPIDSTTEVSLENISNEVKEVKEEEFKIENAWETTLDYNPDSEVNNFKRIKTWTRKLIPKNIL